MPAPRAPERYSLTMRSPSQALGVILVAIGAVGLVASIGRDSSLVDSLQWLWPLAIVGAGAWLLLAATGSGGWGRRGWDDSRAVPGAPGAPPAPPAGTSATGAVTGVVPAGAPATGGGSVPTPTAAFAAAEWTSAAPAAAGASATPPPSAIPSAGPAVSAGPGAGRALPGSWSQHERFFGEIELAGPITLTPATYETVFGEIRLDLSAAILPEGETYLRVGTVFGEVRVLLPPDAAATVRGTSLLGETEILGVSGGSVMGEAVATTDNWTASTRRLRIDARTVLGGVAVRRARPPAWPSTPGPYGAPGPGAPAGGTPAG
jgi:hypothetical protein